MWVKEHMGSYKQVASNVALSPLSFQQDAPPQLSTNNFPSNNIPSLCFCSPIKEVCSFLNFECLFEPIFHSHPSDPFSPWIRLGEDNKMSVFFVTYFVWIHCQFWISQWYGPQETACISHILVVELGFRLKRLHSWGCCYSPQQSFWKLMAFHSKPRRLNSHKYNFVWYSKTKSQFSLGLNFKLISPKLICCLCGLWNWWRLTGTADGPKKKEDESVFNFQFSMHKILPPLTTTHRVGKTCIVICTAVSYELVKYLKHCLFNIV